MAEFRGYSRTPKKERKAVQDTIESISVTLSKRRKELGLTQEILAEKVDMSVNTLKCIEQKTRIPSLPMLIRICFALNIKIEIKTK